MNEKSALKRKSQHGSRKKNAIVISEDTNVCKQLISFTNASNDVVSTAIDPTSSNPTQQKSTIRATINTNNENVNEKSIMSNSISCLLKATTLTTPIKINSNKLSPKQNSNTLIPKNNTIKSFHDVENELEYLIE